MDGIFGLEFVMHMIWRKKKDPKLNLKMLWADARNVINHEILLNLTCIDSVVRKWWEKTEEEAVNVHDAKKHVENQQTKDARHNDE